MADGTATRTGARRVGADTPTGTYDATAEVRAALEMLDDMERDIGVLRKTLEELKRSNAGYRGR